MGLKYAGKKLLKEGLEEVGELGGKSVDDLLQVAKEGLEDLPKASDELLDAMKASGRRVDVVDGGEALRFLDLMGAAGSAGGEGTIHILLRVGAARVTALEEFLHGTQDACGILARLGRGAAAERHVKEFMIRHRLLLGLIDEEVAYLQKLIEAGL